jgi:hypothetical protein
LLTLPDLVECRQPTVRTWVPIQATPRSSAPVLSGSTGHSVGWLATRGLCFLRRMRIEHFEMGANINIVNTRCCRPISPMRIDWAGEGCMLSHQALFATLTPTLGSFIITAPFVPLQPDSLVFFVSSLTRNRSSVDHPPCPLIVTAEASEGANESMPLPLAIIPCKFQKKSFPRLSPLLIAIHQNFV